MLPVDLRSKTSKLLRLLSSDRDGEVLATVAALRRTLSGHGLDLHALADIVETNSVEQAPKPAPPDPPSPDAVPDAHEEPNETAAWLAEHAAERLTRRELEFCRDMEDWGNPTDRQLEWLASIADGIACELACEAAGRMPKDVCPRCGQPPHEKAGP